MSPTGSFSSQCLNFSQALMLANWNSSTLQPSTWTMAEGLPHMLCFVSQSTMPEWISGNSMMERIHIQPRVKVLTLSFPTYITWHNLWKVLKLQSTWKFRKTIPHLLWDSSGIMYMKILSKMESHIQMEAVWKVLFSVIHWLGNAGQCLCQH